MSEAVGQRLLTFGRKQNRKSTAHHLFVRQLPFHRFQNISFGRHSIIFIKIVHHPNPIMNVEIIKHTANAIIHFVWYNSSKRHTAYFLRHSGAYSKIFPMAKLQHICSVNIYVQREDRRKKSCYVSKNNANIYLFGHLSHFVQEVSRHVVHALTGRVYFSNK